MICVTGLLNITVLIFAWNLPVSTRSLFSISWRSITHRLLFLICCTVKPSFIPPADIHQLRDLVRYRFKFTNMITCEKNSVLNCLTVSNLKLDDVFNNVFGMSSRSIMEHLLQHPGETFDVISFVDSRCNICRMILTAI